jgi:hypothetical protein
MCSSASTETPSTDAVKLWMSVKVVVPRNTTNQKAMRTSCGRDDSGSGAVPEAAGVLATFLDIASSSFAAEAHERIREPETDRGGARGGDGGGRAGRALRAGLTGEKKTEARKGCRERSNVTQCCGGRRPRPIRLAALGEPPKSCDSCRAATVAH